MMEIEEKRLKLKSDSLSCMMIAAVTIVYVIMMAVLFGLGLVFTKQIYPDMKCYLQSAKVLQEMKEVDCQYIDSQKLKNNLLMI